MVYSMTAFASHPVQTQHWVIYCEIRSVNSRFLDLNLRLPDAMRFLEQDIRRLVGTNLQRGKIECSFRLEAAPGAAIDFALNQGLAGAVIRILGQISRQLDSPAPVSPVEIAKWPGVLSEPELDREELRESTLKALQEALQALVQARKREGAQLQEFIAQRCRLLSDQVIRARRAAPEALAALRHKLKSRIEEVSAEPDEGRLEQELVYLAQKLDVMEELDRMESHLHETGRLLAEDQPVGRKLDFLFQEMNREANTLAAKSASTELTQAAIEMKVLIEQMREQAQNIE